MPPLFHLFTPSSSPSHTSNIPHPLFIANRSLNSVTRVAFALLHHGRPLVYSVSFSLIFKGAINTTYAAPPTYTHVSSHTGGKPFIPHHHLNQAWHPFFSFISHRLVALLCQVLIEAQMWGCWGLMLLERSAPAHMQISSVHVCK